MDGAAGAELPSYTLPTLARMAGESEWYEHQIGRLGDGRDVDPGLHPARAASGFLTGELVRGLRGQRARQRLADRSSSKS